MRRTSSTPRSADAADRIDGGPGNDRLYGGAGDEVLAGRPGGDRLHGGGQDDRLDGGAGGDLLVGGRGADLFRFRPSPGHDVVADFRDDTDTIRLGDGFGFAGAGEALALAAEVRGDVVFDLPSGRLTVRDVTVQAIADDLLV